MKIILPLYLFFPHKQNEDCNSTSIIAKKDKIIKCHWLQCLAQKKAQTFLNGDDYDGFGDFLLPGKCVT